MRGRTSVKRSPTRVPCRADASSTTYCWIDASTGSSGIQTTVALGAADSTSLATAPAGGSSVSSGRSRWPASTRPNCFTMRARGAVPLSALSTRTTPVGTINCPSFSSRLPSV